MELTYVQIKILDWQKYSRPNNPNQKHFYWFKLPNNMMDDAPFSHLTGDELKAWILILSECSKHNGPTLRLCYEQFSSRFRLKWVTIRNALRKLQAFGIIEVSSTDTTKAAHLEIRSDKRREDKALIQFSSSDEKAGSGWPKGLPDLLRRHGVKNLNEAIRKKVPPG